MPRALYAIGDVHGDASRLVGLLQAHGLLSFGQGSIQWCKPDVIVLLMGDLLDAKSRHGEFGDMCFENTLSDMWIIEFLRTAASEASKQNSVVMCLLGNHELLNLNGNFAYASPHHCKDVQKRIAYFTNGGGRAAFSELFLTSITYNGVLYSHAGIPLRATETQLKLLNKRVTDSLLKLADKQDLEDLVSHRDYYPMSAPESTFEAQTVCRRHNVKKMVIGHNYTGQGVVQDYGGAVVYTDVGISKAFTITPTTACQQILFDPGNGDLQVLNPDLSVQEIPARVG